MKSSSNRFWVLLGPPLSGLLLITALYVKKPGARDFIDHRCPWVKETVGKYAPPFEVRYVAPAPSTAPVESEAASVKIAAANENRPSITQIPQPSPLVTREEPPSRPIPKADSFDIAKVCADPARWPKTVQLKTSVEFPAVIEGKVVGKLRAPVGAEARVVKISNGQVGVEYHGGGAWLTFDRTDFVERARLAWR